MEATPLPMVTDEREEHPRNAEFPMEVTLSGMITDEREEHPRNAEDPMDSIPSPNVTCVSADRLRYQGVYR